MLAGLLLGVRYSLSFIYFIAVLAGSQTVSLILNTVFLFGVSHKWLRPSFKTIKISALKELFFTGGFFFVSGIAGVLAFPALADILSQASHSGFGAHTKCLVGW